MAARGVGPAVAAEMHAPPPRRPRIFAPIVGPPGLYQGDLFFLERYARQNRQKRGILLLIEVATRYAYARPFRLKSETPRLLSEILQQAQADGRPVRVLETDAGTEFKGGATVRELDDVGARLFTVDPAGNGTGIVERANRTFRGLIERHFTSTGGYNWVDALPDIVRGYNEHKHRALKGFSPATMTPGQVAKLRIIAKKRAEDYTEGQAARIEIGDMVRTLRKKSPLEKGATPNWSADVSEVLGYAPPKRVILWTPSGDVVKKPVDEIRESKFRREAVPTPVQRVSRGELGRAMRVRQEERREDVDHGNILPARTRSQVRRTRSRGRII